jgi:hypothetical protein
MIPGITPLSINALGIKTLSIMPLVIMTFNLNQLEYKTQHSL